MWAGEQRWYSASGRLKSHVEMSTNSMGVLRTAVQLDSAACRLSVGIFVQPCLQVGSRRLADPAPPRSAESFIPWDTFAQSVTEAQQLSQAEDLDFLQRTERTRCHCRRTFQAQTLAKKNRRELKGLVKGDSNGETVKAEMRQVAKIISARRF